MAVRPLSSYEELVEASGNDPFARWMVDPAGPVRGWALDDGVAWLRRTHSYATTVTVLTSPRAAAAQLAELLSVVPDITRVTLPFGSLELLPPELAARVVPRAGDDWEWMMTRTPPPAGRPAVVVPPDQLDDVRELLARASPRHSTTVQDPVVAWWGIWDGGRLVACAAHTEDVPGVPSLASVATDPAVRGRGLGAAVTTAAARAAFDAGSAVVTLGMYSDNDVARRMYHRLGFSCDHRWSSRRLR
ncbi:GNAT family N-acetyltransferase [Angustibacter sp. McL0619]|uniref:GNAT family N-acetyltransferase n=1 Tax=Angustibacter sp. McL0619 TaxID=3415676 RepID=UPI003CFA09FD